MKAIRKQIRAYFDIAVILSALATLMILFAVIVPIPKPTLDFSPDVAPGISSYELAKELHTELKEQSKKSDDIQGRVSFWETEI